MLALLQEYEIVSNRLGEDLSADEMEKLLDGKIVPKDEARNKADSRNRSKRERLGI